MTSAVRRGRTLDPRAVAMATKSRRDRIKYLESQVTKGEATFKERKELIFKWGYKLENDKIVARGTVR